MLKILLGTDWKVNKDTVLQMVARDVAEEKGGRILMVPELVSHQTERELCGYAGDSASRFAEVLSFTRLAKRVAQETGRKMMDCLDSGGRVVAMAAATRQLHSKLKAYAAVETKPEFLMGLLDAVDEFKRCCILPGDLLEASRQTEGSLAQKLEELSLILESYNSICARGKRDPRDQMAWLLELLEDCDFAQKHIFYFDAFPDFSRQHMDILCHLIQNSPQVIVSLNCDRPGSDALAFEKAGETARDLIAFAHRNGISYEIQNLSVSNENLQTLSNSLLQGTILDGSCANFLKVYKAESPYSECKAVCEKIIELVQNGCRYRDISVVCADLQSYKNTLQTMLTRAHIPFYLSGTEDILDKTVIHTVLTAIDAALGGFDQKDVLRYLKSTLSPLDIEQCDKLENYAILWSIDGNRWLDPWENHPKGMAELWTQWDQDALVSLNRWKEQAIQPLARLREGFKKAVGVQQQVSALYDFLTDIQLSSRLQKLAKQMDEQGDNRNAQILNQLWDILITALEQVYDVLAEVTWDADTFTKLLKLLLSQYDVGTIPSLLDSVTAGSISAMRCQKSKHLFILGASEGAFPAYGTSAGVLNDQERALLLKLGIPLNPGAIDGLQTQFSEIQEVFCGATDSISVFCSDSQPSFIFNRLRRMAGREESASSRYGAALTDSWEAAALLYTAKDMESAEAMSLEKEYCQIDRSCGHTLGFVAEDTVKRLYGESLHLSASQIDRLAECRLSYFLKYGLRATERKSAKIDPAEFGTYVHAVLEDCGKAVVELGGFHNVSLEKTLEIASELSAKYFAENFSQISNERISYHFQKNTREVQHIVRELWRELQQSQFQPVDFELQFGGEGKMPSIAIAGQKMGAELGGFVDRVDCWQCNGKPYIRVVDYKTGKKDFDYCDVANGIGLQMLLYLYALEDGGEALFGDQPIVAGVQYFPARVPLVAAEGSMTDEEADDAHIKEFKRKGLILSDENVLQAMEPGDDPKRLSVKRTKDGAISGDIATSHQFVQLKKYIYKILRGIVDDIASGNVTPNPYTRGASHSACKFCPYGTVCHAADVEGRRNFKKISSDEFWKQIEKEVQ